MGVSDLLHAGGLPGRVRPLVRAVLTVVGAIGIAVPGYAFEFDTGTETKVRWDNTFKYSAAWRVKDRSNALLADANLDDGNRNFGKGLVSNRLDWLTELDVTHRDIGFRLSGAAWYDDVYNHGNDNNSAATSNTTTVPNNQFTSGTEKLHGRKAELLDAFAFGRFNLGDMPATIRLGKHTLLYGESLFFGANGIAAAQAPVDIIKLLTVPSTQFKELLMPVNQLSGQIQIRPNVAVGAYYQFQWKKNRIPGSGSYLSDVDFVDVGADRLFVPGAFPLWLGRGADINASDSGQWGLQLRFRPEGGDTEYGLYAANFHSKDFQIYVTPTPPPGPDLRLGTYSLVYPKNIKVYGASISTVVGRTNVAGEISYRRNMPLVSDPQVDLAGTANNDSNPLYAVGTSLHAQVSAIFLLPPTALWQGGDILAELAWHERRSIDKNPAAIDPNTTRDAWAFRMIFTPQYAQALPGVDLTVPIGLGYNLKGRSSVIGKFNGGVEGGGDFSIGVNGEYLRTWKFGVNYVHFFGPEGTFLTPPNSPTPVLSYDQSLKDRDFISVFVQRTF